MKWPVKRMHFIRLPGKINKFITKIIISLRDHPGSKGAFAKPDTSRYHDPIIFVSQSSGMKEHPILAVKRKLITNFT